LPLKILHTADLHLGMTFRNRNYSEEVREQLTEARFNTLERLVERANEEKCGLFVIAGDLFHRVNVASDIIERTCDLLSRFRGCLAILPGNHDHYEPYGSLWIELKNKAAEELLLLTEQQVYPLNDYGIDAVIYPATCTAKHSPENRLGWIKNLGEKPEARWHIGVAHGAVKGISPDFENQYYPMEENELVSTGMDIWCLGHTHVRYPDREQVEKAPFLYCGTPEPDGFDCRHGGYAWIIEVDEHGDSFSQSIETGSFRFYEMKQRVMNWADLEELDRGLATTSPPQKKLVKIKLSGTLPEEEYNCRQQFYEQIRETYLHVELDDSELSMEITPEVISASYPEGSFPYRLLNRLAEKNDREALQIAYRLIEEVKQ